MGKGPDEDHLTPWQSHFLVHGDMRLMAETGCAWECLFKGASPVTGFELEKQN